MKPDWVKIVVGILYFTAVAFGPPAVLLWSWRKWHSWRGLGVVCALLPLVIFGLSGGLAAMVTLIQCLSEAPPGPKGYGSGWTLAEYVWFTFGIVGIYSLMFAGAFATVWAPMLVGWRFIHPKSFRWLTSRRPRALPTIAELDFQEPMGPKGLGVADDMTPDVPMAERTEISKP